MLLFYDLNYKEVSINMKLVQIFKKLEGLMVEE